MFRVSRAAKALKVPGESKKYSCLIKHKTGKGQIVRTEMCVNCQ